MAARITTLILVTGLFAAAWSTDHPPHANDVRIGVRSRQSHGVESMRRCLAAPVSFPPVGYDAIDIHGRKLRITVAVIPETAKTETEKR